MTFIGIFTEDGLDSVVETRAKMYRECSDLKLMGFSPKVHVTEGEHVLHLIHDHMRAGRSFVTARRKAVAGEAVPS